MVELKNIEAFLAVVEKGTFSEAEEALYITQPTISTRIQLMEQELNVKLFERVNGKKVKLTPMGERVKPFFQQGFQFIQQGFNELNKIAQTQLTMTISMPIHMGVEIIPELLNKLYNVFSDIEFKVKIRKTSEIIQELRCGEVDAGFIYTMHYGAFAGNDLLAVHIADVENILICSSEHRLSKLDEILFSDLNEERIFSLSKNFTPNQIIADYLKKNGLRQYKAVEINDLGWIKGTIRKNLGIAFLPKMIVYDELKSGALIELPLAKALPSTSISLVFRTNVEEHFRSAITEIAKNIFQNFS